MKYNNNEYNTVQKVTPIEFLSDLEELESGNHKSDISNPHQDNNKYKKFIRNESHTIAPQAGMNPVPKQQQKQQQQQQQYITNDNQ